MNLQNTKNKLMLSLILYYILKSLHSLIEDPYLQPVISASTPAHKLLFTYKRLFTYKSPSTSNPATPTRRPDTPTDEAFSMGPVGAASRQLLEIPYRQLHSVCKRPIEYWTHLN